MFEAIFFLFGIIFLLFLPGRLILHLINKKFSGFETIIFSFAIAIPAFTFLAYIFGYLGISFLVAPFLLILDLVLFSKYHWRPNFRDIKIDRLILISVLMGSLFQTVYMLKSGLNFGQGIGFWGVHGYDAVWHLALIQEMINHFPPQNPGFSGELLKNYHYLTDLFYAQFSKITFVSPINLYFRFGPILISVILNSLIFILAKKWTGKAWVGFWAIFFVSLCGSFGWVPPLFGKGSNNWETAFWSIQTPSSFLNPPFAFSLMILTLAIIFIFELNLEKNNKLMLATAFLLGILFGFKIYAAIIVLLALSFIALIRLFKKDFTFLIICLMTIPFALVVFLPSSSGSTGFLVWHPWWFIRTMVEAPDRLNWSSLELRRQVYVTFNNYKSLFLLHSFLFVIFIVGNLGTRFIGIFSIVKRLYERKILDIFLFLLLIVAFLPPIFFIQKSVPWNSIQFMYYFIFFASFFAAETIVFLFEKINFKIVKLFLIILVFGFSLPSTLETIYWFNSPVPTTLLENTELEGLNYLKEKTPKDSIILTYPFNYAIAKSYKEPPVPMTYYNSPYVSFFSTRRVYLEDMNAATILDYPLSERLAKEEKFFSTKIEDEAINFLKENNIDYIYLADHRDMLFDKNLAGLEEVFNNNKVRIYKVSDKI